MNRILVVDDEEDMLEVCRDALSRIGVPVETESDPRRALERVCAESFGVVIADIKMPGLTGIDLLRTIRRSSADTAVILITAFASEEAVEESVRHSAQGFITKPFTREQLTSTVLRALARQRLQEPAAAGAPAASGPFDGMIGTSAPMRAVFGLIEQVAPTEIDVLILGESGTGKELIARSIHRRSARAPHRFVPVDCGAIPENLLESELFGHERGAFTGATSTAIGLMEFAHQGTLFLDEVCELAPSLQAKLLRALQERQIRRVGGSDLLPIDIRVIAATNKDIQTEVRAGRFREDLFYRLHALRIEVPPLRSRKEDLRPLFDHFLARAAHEAHKPGLRTEADVFEVLAQYSWPGNVREVQNVARRAAVVCAAGVVHRADLPAEVLQIPSDADAGETGFFLERSVRNREFERRYIMELLQRHGGDVRAAAEEARLPRGTLYRLMKKHGLASDQFERKKASGNR